MTDLDEPTVLTRKDIDDFIEKLQTEEIKPAECFQCRKKYYFGSYGHHLNECDECFFKRFSSEQKESFFRSFLE